MRIRRRHYAAALGALAVSGALVAGCGSSGDSSTTTAQSQSEFAAQAAAVCKPAGQQIEAAAHKYLGSGGRPSAQDLEQFVTAAVVPDTQKVIDGFRGLTPPSSQAQTYSALIDELQSTNDQLKANPQLLAQQGDPFAKSNQLAKQAGLDACISD
jgi:uncharacterized protein (DUF1778 family)